MKRHLCTLLLAAVSGSAFSSSVEVGNTTVTGFSVLSVTEVQALLEPYSQTIGDPGDQWQATEALRVALRDAGAFAAKVYPQWNERSQHLTLTVMEGRLAEDGIVLGRSSKRVDDSVIHQQLKSILEPGTTLTADKYERAILLTNDLPGVGGSEAVLFPSDEVGEAKFESFPYDGNLIEGHVSFDNFGSTYTGRNRAGAILDINSPFHKGEKISLAANITNEDTTFGYFDGSIPVGLPGVRVGISADTSSYKTDEPSNLRGTSDDLSAYLNYPVIRSRQLNLYGELRYGREDMHDKTDLSTIADRVVDVGSLRLYGDYADGFNGGGISKLDLSLVMGNVDLSGYSPYEIEDAQTAKTAGQFSRLPWTVSRLQHLYGPWQTYIELAGQEASKRLDASQGITFGGPYDFPGYYSGEIIGDEGRRLHWDLRYNVAEPVLGGQQQWSVFYDVGQIRSHAIAVVGGFVVPGINENTYTMKSAGFGFSQTWPHVQLQAALGWRIDNEIPDRLLDGDSDGAMHGWLQLVYNF